MYNHIPGHGVLKRKDLVVDSFMYLSRSPLLEITFKIRDYQKRFANKPQCLKEIDFFPKSYRLYSKANYNYLYESD